MKWVIIRVNPNGEMSPSRSSQWYPRYGEGETPEEAIESMFDGGLRTIGEKTLLVLPIESGSIVSVKPRREFDMRVERADSFIS